MIRKGKIVYFSNRYIKIRDPVSHFDICGKVTSMPEALHDVPGQHLIDQEVEYEIESSNLVSNDPCGTNKFKIHKLI